MRTLLLALTALLIALTGCSSPAADRQHSPDADFPDTPAARALIELVTALNTGEEGELLRFARNRFSDAQDDSSYFAKRIERILQVHRTSGGLDVAYVLPSLRQHVAAIAQGRRDGDWWRVSLGVSPEKKIQWTRMRRQRLLPGDPAPAIPQDLNWIKGDSTSEFREGQVYVLDFWAPWCAPCVKLFPHLSQVARRYRARGVRVVGISTLPSEGQTPTREFVDRMGDSMDYAVVEDRENQLAGLYDIIGNGIPTTVIVDGRGRIMWSWAGFDAPVERVLEQLLEGDLVLPALRSREIRPQAD